MATVDQVTTEWAAQFFALNLGEDRGDVRHRSIPWMSDELIADLGDDLGPGRIPDQAWLVFDRTGSACQVTNVTIRPDPGEVTPPDTIDRATRIIEVTISFTHGPWAGDSGTDVYAVALQLDKYGQWKVTEFTTGDS